MTGRLAILTMVFVAGAALVEATSRPERVPVREPLEAMPYSLDHWSGYDAPKLSEAVLAQLGADDHLERIYSGSDRVPVFLYIGYYESQRQGDSIHSPMNCLPGAGWSPTRIATFQVPVGSGAPPISVKRVLIQKGIDRQVVLYWYQSHGRSIPNEYWSKFFLVYDALRLNRSDATLIRVSSPVLPAESSDAPAEGRAVTFVQALVPRLSRYLPS